MIHQMFAVRDLKAEAYLQPFFSQNNGTAIRAFVDAVNKDDSPFNKHPEDYALYLLGSFDDDTGVVQELTLKNLGLAADFINK